ncbi:MAG: hypothetical protein CMO55_00755 [Verrucomicrobiales bacterium]|nr:hypothetical protein [Verrucomicrobiales bacterium]
MNKANKICGYLQRSVRGWNSVYLGAVLTIVFAAIAWGTTCYSVSQEDPAEDVNTCELNNDDSGNGCTGYCEDYTFSHQDDVCDSSGSDYEECKFQSPPLVGTVDYTNSLCEPDFGGGCVCASEPFGEQSGTWTFNSFDTSADFCPDPPDDDDDEV